MSEQIEQRRKECKQPSLQQLISTLKPCKIFDEEEYQILFTRNKDSNSNGCDKWSAGYYSFDNCCWLLVGYGKTLRSAILHLKKQLRLR